jgi:hypothetical protein
MRKTVIIIAILTAGFFLLPAQSEEDLFGSEDDLFGEDTLVQEHDNPENAMEDLLLTDENVVSIGGSFDLSLSASGSFDPSETSSTDDMDWDLSPDLSARLYIDARPDSDIRVYGSVDVEYPFTTSEDDSSTAEDETRDFDDIIRINELFSDFNINEEIFFRAGKQTINWGVGYYFSPADLLNLTEIDPEDPDAELEGPLSVKINRPLDMHNLYLYTVFPEGVKDPSDIAFAPRAEFVLGGTEIGIGAYYRYEQAPAAMVTFTSTLQDINLFGEGVVKYGSDKTYIVEEDSSYTLKTYSEKLFFLATLGASYTWNADESDLSYTLMGQYYFNGEGYSDRSIFTSSTGASYVVSSYVSGDISQSDLSETSMHYGAASFSLTPVEDLTFSVLWMGNFTDFSGLIKPGLSWDATEYISLAMNFPYYYGDTGDEFTSNGDNFSFTLEVSLGGTDF